MKKIELTKEQVEEKKNDLAREEIALEKLKIQFEAFSKQVESGLLLKEFQHSIVTSIANYKRDISLKENNIKIYQRDISNKTSEIFDEQDG